jgi:hypothetical protein
MKEDAFFIGKPVASVTLLAAAMGAAAVGELG